MNLRKLLMAATGVIGLATPVLTTVACKNEAANIVATNKIDLASLQNTKVFLFKTGLVDVKVVKAAIDQAILGKLNKQTPKVNLSRSDFSVSWNAKFEKTTTVTDNGTLIEGHAFNVGENSPTTKVQVTPTPSGLSKFNEDKEVTITVTFEEIVSVDLTNVKTAKTTVLVDKNNKATSTSVEIAVKDAIVKEINKDYITLEHLDFIDFKSDTKNLDALVDATKPVTVKVKPSVNGVQFFTAKDVEQVVIVTLTGVTKLDLSGLTVGKAVTITLANDAAKVTVAKGLIEKAVKDEVLKQIKVIANANKPTFAEEDLVITITKKDDALDATDNDLSKEVSLQVTITLSDAGKEKFELVSAPLTVKVNAIVSATE